LSIIIGIDPGSIRTGWGVVTTAPSGKSGSDVKCLGFGVIELPERQPLAVRLGKLHQELEVLVQKFKPTAMSIEKIFMAKNADSAFKLGHARGVAMAIAGVHGLDVAEYATRSAKKMLTGSGGANKEQVQFLIQHMLGIRTQSLDATDALCLAVAHARELEVSQAMARQNKELGKNIGRDL
jgi:crossover junction endodeoxyribonuclease RuvC